MYIRNAPNRHAARLQRPGRRDLRVRDISIGTSAWPTGDARTSGRTAPGTTATRKASQPRNGQASAPAPSQRPQIGSSHATPTPWPSIQAAAQTTVASTPGQQGRQGTANSAARLRPSKPDRNRTHQPVPCEKLPFVCHVSRTWRTCHGRPAEREPMPAMNTAASRRWAAGRAFVDRAVTSRRPRSPTRAGCLRAARPGPRRPDRRSAQPCPRARRSRPRDRPTTRTSA